MKHRGTKLKLENEFTADNAVWMLTAEMHSKALLEMQKCEFNAWNPKCIAQQNSQESELLVLNTAVGVLVVVWILTRQPCGHVQSNLFLWSRIVEKRDGKKLSMNVVRACFDSLIVNFFYTVYDSEI